MIMCSFIIANPLLAAGRIFRAPFFIYSIPDVHTECKQRFVQTYKSYLYIIHIFVIVYMCSRRLSALRAQFAPRLLHRIGGEKELARAVVHFDMAVHVLELGGHGYRLPFAFSASLNEMVKVI